MTGLKVSKYFHLVAGVLFLVMPGEAAFAATVSTFSWIEAVERANRFNPELEAARSSLKASGYQVKAAWSGFFPQLSANLGYSYGNNFSNNPAVDMGTSSNYTTSLSGSENLFNGFQDQGKIAQNQANEQTVRASLESVKAKVSADLKTGFEGVLFAQKSIVLSDSIIERRHRNLELVELRFEDGRENKGSLLLSQAYLNQAHWDHLQAQHALEIAQVQLARVLGFDSEQDDLPNVQGTVPIQNPASKLDLKILALSTPDHLQAFSQEQGALASVTLAQGTLFPSLSLTGSVGKQGAEWFPQNNRWSMGVGLSYSFFSGGKDFYSTRSAIAAHQAASQTLANTDRVVLTKLKQAWSSYVEAVEKLKVDVSFLEAAKTRADIGRGKYNNGLLSFEEWDLIETDLISREKTALQSERDRVIAEAGWEQALGKGVIR
ncbi:TolC family protein [Bdellovibrionota bacterium FG-1]